jgi:hypothetical protein
MRRARSEATNTADSFLIRLNLKFSLHYPTSIFHTQGCSFAYLSKADNTLSFNSELQPPTVLEVN